MGVGTRDLDLGGWGGLGWGRVHMEHFGHDHFLHHPRHTTHNTRHTRRHKNPSWSSKQHSTASFFLETLSRRSV
jgi:hypothetical protein